MQIEHLKVTGMTSGGCVTTVTRALKNMDGVTDVTVSLSRGDTTVRYDERLTSPEKLKLVVMGTGYGLEAIGGAKGESLKGGCSG